MSASSREPVRTKKPTAADFDFGLCSPIRVRPLGAYGDGTLSFFQWLAPAIRARTSLSPQPVALAAPGANRDGLKP